MVRVLPPATHHLDPLPTWSPGFALGLANPGRASHTFPQQQNRIWGKLAGSNRNPIYCFAFPPYSFNQMHQLEIIKHVYLWIFICIHTMYTCNPHMRMCLHIHTHTRMHVCTHNTHTCKYVSICTHTYIYRYNPGLQVWRNSEMLFLFPYLHLSVNLMLCLTGQKWAEMERWVEESSVLVLPTFYKELLL